MSLTRTKLSYTERQKYIRAAKDFYYPPWVINRLLEAETEEQASRIMTTARKRRIEDEFEKDK